MKKNLFNRVLASFLVTVLIICIFPTTVYADQIIDSGICGQNVNWEIYTDHSPDSGYTLRIYGEGPIEDTSYFSYKSYIKTIIIEEGITSLIENGFADYTELRTVKIEANIEEIPNNAFINCPALTDIYLPATLISIDITISSNPDIPYSFSASDNLENIYFAGTKAEWNIICGIWVFMEKNVSVQCVDGVATHEHRMSVVNRALTVPSANCNHLTQENLLFFDGYRFCNICIKDTSEVPYSFPDIESNYCGDNATWSCVDDTLTISGTGELYGYPFYGGPCFVPWAKYTEKIKHVVIEDGITHIGNFGAGLFFVEKVDLPESLIAIDSYAFSCCPYLKEINIPKNVEYIGLYAINTTSLETITFDTLCVFNHGIFCSSISSTDHEVNMNYYLWLMFYFNVYTVFADDDFSYFCGLTEEDVWVWTDYQKDIICRFAAPVKTIYRTDLENRTILEQIVLLGDVFEYFDNSTFDFTLYNGDVDSSVSGLRTIRIKGHEGYEQRIADKYGAEYEIIHDWSDWSNFRNIDRYILRNRTCSICGKTETEVVDEEGIILGYGQCGDDLYWIFDNQGTLTIDGTGSMYNYEDVDETPWWYVQENTAEGDYRTKIKRVIFNEGITTISDYAFCSEIALSEVSFASTIESIGAYSFYNCYNLSEIYLPTQLKSIGAGAFAGTTLSQLQIPHSCNEIGDECFDLASENLSFITDLYILNDQLSLDSCFNNAINATDFSEFVTPVSCLNFYLYVLLDSINNYDSYLDVLNDQESFYLFSAQAKFEITENQIDFIHNCLSLINQILDTDFNTPEELFTESCISAGEIYDENCFTDLLKTAIENRFESSYIEIAESIEELQWVTIYGHSGATSETFANKIGARFICLHEYVDGVCKYCGEHETTEPDWGDWTDDENGQTHTRVDNNNSENTQTEDHSWNDGDITTPASCISEGVKTLECSVCGATKTEPIPVDDHTLTFTAAVPATCTTAGNSAYWTCSVCGKFFSDESGATELAEDSWVINATGHTLTPTAAVPATCTTAGNSAYWTCSVCGKFFSDEGGATEIAEDSWIINATGHALIPTAAVPATCTTAGNSAYWTCSVCGKFFSDESGATELTEDSWIISAAHGLDLGFDEEEVASTCRTAGYYTKTCLDCGEIVESRTYEKDPKNHVGGTEIRNKKPASCIENGYTGDLCCKGCDAIMTPGVVSPLIAHTLVLTAATPADCATAGNSAYWTCSFCGKSFSDENGATEIGENSWIIPAAHGLDLGFDEEEVASTCRTAGYYTKTCLDCGEIVESRTYEKDPDNHAGGAELRNEIPATCTDNGYTGDLCCKSCGDVLVPGEEIPAHGHKFTNYISDNNATCTKDGTMTASCDYDCGTTDTKTQANSALGHDWSEWTVLTAPTYLFTGERSRECGRCHLTEKEEIAKLIPDDNKIDPDTGSQVGYKDGVLPADTQIVVDEEFDGVYFRLLNAEKGNIRKQLFNITLESNGEKVQPDGLVLVRLPIPEGFNPIYLHVYYIASDGSGIELIDSYIDGDFICFETTHFSEYAIVDESPDQENPETPESNCVCGKYHSGPFAGLIKFFHQIEYFFKRLFSI